MEHSAPPTIPVTTMDEKYMQCSISSFFINFLIQLVSLRSRVKTEVMEHSAPPTIPVTTPETQSATTFSEGGIKKEYRLHLRSLKSMEYPQRKMIFFVLFLTSFSYVLGGTKCPDRSKIYPCICLDKPIGKSKYDTLVICEGLTSGDSIRSIEPELSKIEMDRFLLYDSYWSSDARLLRANARMPVNYISVFKIKEVILQDTVLSSFSCPQTDNCRTNYLKRFSAFNSTVSVIGPTCSNHSTIHAWMSCPENIEHVLIQGGHGTEDMLQLRPDYFPVVHHKLKTLRMPYNHITRVEKRTFSSAKFPDLETLDLSHNLLRELHILSPTSLKLKYLDLSYNNIRTAPEFQFLTNLKFLNLSRNHIISLLHNEWVNTPPNLRVIDLSSNSLDCNCATKWVNSTFHVSTNLLGECVSPPVFVNMKIRKASRLLNERCTAQGQILPSITTTTTAATTQ